MDVFQTWIGPFEKAVEHREEAVLHHRSTLRSFVLVVACVFRCQPVPFLVMLDLALCKWQGIQRTRRNYCSALLCYAVRILLQVLV